MKLVVKTILESDMSFFTQVRPVEYDSPEAFLCDLEVAARHAQEQGYWCVKFAGHNWQLDEFGYQIGVKKMRSNAVKYKWHWNWDAVEIMTIDEWFQRYSKTK